jgi:hypothetical protein
MKAAKGPSWMDFFVKTFGDLQKGALKGVSPYDPVTAEGLDEVIKAMTQAKANLFLLKEVTDEALGRR